MVALRPYSPYDEGTPREEYGRASRFDPVSLPQMALTERSMRAHGSGMERMTLV